MFESILFKVFTGIVGLGIGWCLGEKIRKHRVK